MNLKSVEFQLCTDPEGDGLVLEFLDPHGDAFMEIGIREDETHEVMIYKSSEAIAFPLSELLKGIELAKARVKNVPL